MIVDLTADLIRKDDSVTFREATSLVACARKSILDLLPTYEDEFESIVRPRLERLIRRRWPLEHSTEGAFSSELVN